jgi:uncharacterized NAD(P)/FAD-binding protein YdhS
MATSEEKNQAIRLLKIHRRNLGRLEEKKANLAGAIDLAVENQIDEERANIAALEPIANPPPLLSPKVAEFVRQTTPSDIDNTMLFMQGVQLNARMTRAEEHDAKQDERLQQIIKDQARASVDRMLAKEAVESLSGQVAASERSRKGGARWYRRAIVGALSMAVLALIIGCAALSAVLR